VRGRVGYVEGGALFYVTGGGAYGRVNQNADFTNAFNSPAVNSAFTSNTSTIQNRFGFAVGAGLEASLGGNWTGKIEYLYLDLGTIGPTTVNTLLAGSAPSPVAFTATSNIHDNIVRAGLNYRIGAPAAPLSAYGAMAAMPPAVPIYNWTGFYVGANVGYGFGNGRHQTDAEQNASGTTAALFGGPGGDITPKGFIGGGQVGYNWQGSPHWLIGFEADLQGSAIKDTTCISLTCFNGMEGVGASGTNTVNLTHQIDWFSTVRGRVGFIADNSLFYATGGAAFAHVKQMIETNSSISTGGVFQTDTSASDVIGYVVGGGIETMLWGGWSAKAEYLYMNLGDLRLVNTIGAPPDTLTLTTNSTVREHIVRVGANYHFTAAHY
jgi:outer membrane immunogenic protein